MAGCSSESEPDRPVLPPDVDVDCGVAPTEPAATSEPSAAPAASAIDTSDPGELGRTVVQAWFSYDTRTDVNRNDAPGARCRTRRADGRARCAGPPRCRGAGQGDRRLGAVGRAGGDGHRRGHRGTQSGQANTESKYHGMYRVTSTVTDSSGTEIGSDVQFVAVVLIDNGDGWRVSSVTTL